MKKEDKKELKKCEVCWKRKEDVEKRVDLYVYEFTGELKVLDMCLECCLEKSNDI